MNTWVQEAWALVLPRLCGQESVAFGASFAGRAAELLCIEAQIGRFINARPVIAAPQPQQGVADSLQGMKALNLALREHVHTPL
ncbi:condensation domain-containing protein, partial [Pseudomonas aeruginosa]